MGTLAAALGVEASEAVEAALARLVEESGSAAARADPTGFARFLRDLPARDAAATGSIGEAGARELGLAFGCSLGDAAAQRAFEERFVARVPGHLARMKLDAAAVDDVVQRVREKLLLADDGAPRFARYAGRGELDGLVRVTATREAVSLVRKDRREDPLGPDDLLDASETEPELRLARERYRPVFREAFAAALGSLERRERNLLRLHVVEGATLEALAALYQVHRATIVRWLAKAREGLVAATGRELQRRTGARPDEVESLLGLLASRVDLTLERLLSSGE